MKKTYKLSHKGEVGISLTEEEEKGTQKGDPGAWESKIISFQRSALVLCDWSLSGRDRSEAVKAGKG